MSLRPLQEENELLFSIELAYVHRFCKGIGHALVFRNGLIDYQKCGQGYFVEPLLS